MSKNNQPTILFIYPTPFNPERGGVERVTDILTKSLIRRGYPIYYMHHRSDMDVLNYNYPAPVYFFPSSNLSDSENIIFYHQFLKEKKIDIIINQCGLFGDSKLYLNIGQNSHIKTISVLHSNPLLNYDFLKEEILKIRNSSFIEYCKLMARFFLYPKIKSQYWKNRKLQYDFLLKNTDIICLLSSNFKKELQRIYLGKIDKVTAIGNPNSFQVSTIPQNKEKTLLYVGRLDRGQKRPDRLLKIWKLIYKKNPDWKLIFVGDGEQRKELEKKAKQLDRISFVGYQSPEEYYKKASILCMTSNFEGFGMVLTEAMQFGTVPIAFNSYASASDIIKDGVTGFLIEPFDLKVYADKLRYLMRNKEKRVEMAKRGFESVKKFDIENITNQWENLFNQLLA
ncbi:glycosyltransferase [Bacteroidales bacterium OttesenSCG-928-M11]|nr:glycosyltransferase [Bacteroidales bacterium OttesenSCG-928-M11]